MNCSNLLHINIKLIYTPYTYCNSMGVETKVNKMREGWLSYSVRKRRKINK